MKHGKPASSPGSLRSRQLLAAALLLGLALGALALAFVAFEWREIRETQLSEAALYARSLEDHASSVVSATDSVLRSLATAVDPAVASGHAEALAPLLTESLRGRPFLRSVAWLDAQGRVLVSSNPADVGLSLTPEQLGGADLARAASQTAPQGSRLASLASGRDLRELGRAPLTGARVLALPMVLPFETAEGTGNLVALINPDHIATQFERAIDGKPLQALLIGLDGKLLVATSGVAVEPGASLLALPAFTQHLPAREFAAGVGRGAEGERVLSAFRATRLWPLVVVVEQPYQVFLATVGVAAKWALGFLLLAWLLLGLGTAAARRALLRDERLSRDLAHAHAATKASEARARATFEQAAVGMLQQDADRRILRVNQTLCELLGYRREALLALPYEALIHPDDLMESLNGIRKLFAGELSSFAQDKRYRRKDGRYLWGRLTASISRDGQGNALSMLCIVEDISARRQAEQELAMARERELQVGARIQQTLLVTAPPTDLDGLQISSHSQASQGIDGDFVEVIRIGADCVDLIAGDVMGKGLAAAMMGAATKLQFSRSMAELLMQPGRGLEPPRPAEVVAAVHRAMTPALQGLEAFVTLCYLRLDMKRNRITWVGCGHEETLHIRASGAAEPLLNQHPPLGVLDAADYVEDTRPFAPGDALFLCSDGVTDAVRPDGERVGRDRVTRAAVHRLRAHATPAAALHTLRCDLLVPGVQLQDDVTMVVVQRQPAGERTARLELPLRLQSLRQVRDFVGAQTGAAGLDETECSLLEVACVEAFTNIVRHGEDLVGGAPLELVARREARSLVLELVHLGAAYTPPQEAAETDFGAYPEGGFGLQIIHGASDRVQYLHDDGVNTTRMSKRLH